VVALGLFVALSGVARAEEPGPRLSLQEAAAIALKNHPRLRAAEADAAFAKEGVREAHAAYLPQFRVVATGSEANQPSRIGAGTLPASQLFNRFGQGVELSQLITDWGRTDNLVGASRLHAQASEQGLSATRADVLLEVSRAYFGVLRALALVKVAQETVAARKVLSDQVSELTTHKLRSQLDQSFAQVNLSEAELLEIRAEEQRGSAYAELAHALGEEKPTEYDLVDEAPPASPPASPDGLVDQAIASRPDLASLRLESDAAHRFEDAERDLRRPTVSLVGVAGFLPLIQQNPGARIPNEYGAAAVNIAIPVFSGHLLEARRDAAHDAAVSQDQRTRALTDTVARDVRVAWAGASTAYRRMDVTGELLKEAKLGLDLAQGRYDLGLSSIVELTQAQLNLTQAEVEDLSAKYDYETLDAVLQYTLGALR
jgi:outer membrane protein